MSGDSVETVRQNGGKYVKIDDSGQQANFQTDPINHLLESEEFKQELHRLIDKQLNKPVSPSGVASYYCENGKYPNGRSLPSSPGVKGNSPIIPINDIRPDISRMMSDEEKILRCKLASVYRLVDVHGWTHGIYNHITVRLPKDHNVFLINPFGLLYHEISASNLVKIDRNGNLLERGISHLGVNKAGWVLHSAIHEGRPDVNCVLHLHLPDVVAVSCMKCGLLPVSAEAEELLYDDAGLDTDGHEKVSEPARGTVRYHAYRGIFIDENERVSLIEDLGPRAQVLFLRNHGVAVCGRSIEEVWQLTRSVVSACQTQTHLIQLGGLNMISSMNGGLVKQRRGSLATDREQRLKTATLEFEAMMRLLDNAGYRTGYRYQQPLLMNRVLDSLAELAKETMLQKDFDASVLSPATHHYNEEESLNHLDDIRKQVAANRQKANQRNAWLKHASQVECDSRPSFESIDEIHLKSSQAVCSESKPETVHQKANKGQRASPSATIPTIKVDYFDVANNAAPVSPTSGSGESDFETHGSATKSDHHASESERTHKKGIKIGGIHIPSFSRKKK